MTAKARKKKPTGVGAEGFSIREAPGVESSYD
jgi:hypothetical protein